MSAITSGREVAFTSGFINLTNSLPASIFTPALLYVVLDSLKSAPSSFKVKNLTQHRLNVKPKLDPAGKTS
jgi:hypothetical protein